MYSVARLCSDQSFLTLCHRRRVAGLSDLPVAGMTFPTSHMIPERWMGSRVQSTVGCFPELCFLQFSVEQVLVGF